MASSYVVKVQYNDSLRRLTLGGSEDVFSYTQLESRTRGLFQIPPTAQLVLTYVDKDGDVVTMAEDEDLKDALVLQSLNPLRLNVAITNSTATPNDVKVDSPVDAPVSPSLSEELPKGDIGVVQPGKESEANEDSAAAKTDKKGPAAAASDGAEKNGEQILHHGIQCDGCGMSPLAGPRFKSSKKADYDLCLRCFKADGVDPNDYFKIERMFPRAGYPFVGRRMGLSPSFCSRNSCTPPAAVAADSARTTSPVSSDANDKVSATAVKPDVDAKSVLHNGVRCDDCGMNPIAGPRFKSSTKFNYDLCLGCFEKSGSNSGEYSRIDRPADANVHPLVLLRMARRASPCGSRWGRQVWVMNQAVPQKTVDQAPAAEEKTKAASDGTDVVAKPTAQSGPDSSVAKEPAAGEAASGENLKQEEATTISPVDAKADEITVQVPPTSADVTKSVETEDTVNKSVENASVQNAKEDDSTVQIPPTNAYVAKSVEIEDTVNNSVENASVQNVTAAPVSEGDLFTLDGLLAKLSAMGFTDQKLNAELLEKNKLDLRTTLDDLCAAEDWDPILEELQEMGFYDADMNRRLMFKNNGSVKRVVKELVQLSKEPASGKGKEKA